MSPVAHHRWRSPAGGRNSPSRKRTMACPNVPSCGHSMVLHDIPEDAEVRRNVCTVDDCRCGCLP